MLVHTSVPLSLVDALLQGTEKAENRVLYRFPDSNGLELTYADVLRKAMGLATVLQQRAKRGDRALVVCEPGQDYVIAFLGAACAGLLPVPVFPPDMRRLQATLGRTQAIVANAKPRIALTTADLIAPLTEATQPLPEFSSLDWVAVDSTQFVDSVGWVNPVPSRDGVAFLQYTSGSTRSPRGVMVTHDNLYANAQAIERAGGFGEHPVGVSWLPPYHDMGLIGTILQAVYSGMSLTIISPKAFLRNPIRWLRLISEQRASYSGGPNFAFELCIRKAATETFSDLDLNCWEVAFSGAEPVHPKTLEAFAHTFAPAGFARDALAPSFGLAEATLLATGKRGVRIVSVDKSKLAQGLVEPVESAASSQLASCGKPWGSCEVRIVSPDTLMECSAGTVGEIWLRGSGVAVGYWEQPGLSEETFGARTVAGEGPFFRTGDLGTLHGDELYVLGRIKDLIILNGRNHYPQDLEYTVERAHSALRQAGVAVISITEERIERLVVIAEVAAGRSLDLNAIVDAVQGALQDQHELTAFEVVLIQQRTLPKTSSGKVQRSLAKQQYQQGALYVRFRTRGNQSHAAPNLPGIAAAADSGDVEAWLMARLASAVGVTHDEIDPRRPFASFGIDSALAVEIVTSAQERFGVELAATALWDYPNLKTLAQHIEKRLSAKNEKLALPRTELS